MSKTDNMWGSADTKYFYELLPHDIIDALEQLGLKPTGKIIACSSMENRVYDIELRDSLPIEDVVKHAVVAKFYRPGRWSKEQIQEEHDFLLQLKDCDIPVAYPFNYEGQTLFKMPKADIYFSIFPKCLGKAPSELSDQDLTLLGRLIARVHNVGASKNSKQRLHLTPEIYGLNNKLMLEQLKVIPDQWQEAFSNLVDQIISHCTINNFKSQFIRLHGDCHLQNVLYHSGKFTLIDFDDTVMGPAIQDLWLSTPGRDEQGQQERAQLLQGYTTMRELDPRQLGLVEELRSLRYVHYCCWIAKRITDPAFKRNFPQFGTEKYWQDLVNDLKFQLSILQQKAGQSNYY